MEALAMAQPGGQPFEQMLLAAQQAAEDADMTWPVPVVPLPAFIAPD